MLGGQPTFKQDRGTDNANGADEGHSWSVRLTDPSVLGIYAASEGRICQGFARRWTTFWRAFESSERSRQPRRSQAENSLVH